MKRVQLDPSIRPSVYVTPTVCIISEDIERGAGVPSGQSCERRLNAWCPHFCDLSVCLPSSLSLSLSSFSVRVLFVCSRDRFSLTIGASAASWANSRGGMKRALPGTSEQRGSKTVASYTKSTKRKKKAGPQQLVDGWNDVLQKQFQRNPYPTSEDYDRLSRETGMERRLVPRWFINMRKGGMAKKSYRNGTSSTGGTSRGSSSPRRTKVNLTLVKVEPELEKHFKIHPYPTPAQYQAIAEQLTVEKKIVRRWFIGRRRLQAADEDRAGKKTEVLDPKTSNGNGPESPSSLPPSTQNGVNAMVAAATREMVIAPPVKGKLTTGPAKNKITSFTTRATVAASGPKHGSVGGGNTNGEAGRSESVGQNKNVCSVDAINVDEFSGNSDEPRERRDSLAPVPSTLYYTDSNGMVVSVVQAVGIEGLDSNELAAMTVDEDGNFNGEYAMASYVDDRALEDLVMGEGVIEEEVMDEGVVPEGNLINKSHRYL
jgi:hypothetical protein